MCTKFLLCSNDFAYVMLYRSTYNLIAPLRFPKCVHYGHLYNINIQLRIVNFIFNFILAVMSFASFSAIFNMLPEAIFCILNILPENRSYMQKSLNKIAKP